MQPLPPCLMQQLPGSDLEKQSQFSATSMKSTVPGEQGCANKRRGSWGCGENVCEHQEHQGYRVTVRGTWDSRDASSRQPTLEAGGSCCWDA